MINKTCKATKQKHQGNGDKNHRELYGSINRKFYVSEKLSKLKSMSVCVYMWVWCAIFAQMTVCFFLPQNDVLLGVLHGHLRNDCLWQYLFNNFCKNK